MDKCFTPEPWIILESKYTVGGETHDVIVEAGDSSELPVALVSRKTSEKSGYEVANGKLITAAPALFQDLEFTSELLEDLVDWFQDEFGGEKPISERGIQMLESIEATLAHAKMVMEEATKLTS